MGKNISTRERPIIFSGPEVKDSMENRSVRMGTDVPCGVTTMGIPGVSDRYVAGSDGHIYCYSNAKVNARKQHPFMLAESIGNKGYPFVAIIESGRKRTMAVHTLVCRAFHGEKPGIEHEVRHIDGKKTNNSSDNLAWCTHSENEADKRRHGTAAMGEKHGAAILTDEAVKILRSAIPRGLWNTADAAQVFGVDQSVIRAAVSRKTWKHIA